MSSVPTLVVTTVFIPIFFNLSSITFATDSGTIEPKCITATSTFDRFAKASTLRPLTTALRLLSQRTGNTMYPRSSSPPLTCAQMIRLSHQRARASQARGEWFFGWVIVGFA